MKKIIHIDCDCFFAAVEMRDNPALRGVPLAVGGRADERGVLATCNYEARKFGLHSAMATSEALRRCPQLVLLHPRFAAYKEASQQVKAVFSRYTEKMEVMSLDEAYLDVSDSPHCRGSATLIAQAIRTEIAREVGITASAGIAPNKFLAKIASDWNKPDNQFVIRPDQVDAFVEQLEVKKIPGVGPATLQRMQLLGVVSCADLQKIDLHILVKHFGSFGPRLHQLAHGMDTREVCNDYTRKSLSVEHTFPRDIDSTHECLQAMPSLVDELGQRLARLREQYRIQKLSVKVKFSDFTATTMECRSPALSQETFARLLVNAFNRKHLPARLLGVGVSFSEDLSMQQLPLFPQ